MAYTLPQFVNTFDYWAPGATDMKTDPPTLQDQPCQLYYGFHRMEAFSGFVFVSDLRIPLEVWENMGVPIVNGGVWVKDPTIGNWYYEVLLWDTMHLGMPNAYIVLLCRQCDRFFVVPDSNR